MSSFFGNICSTTGNICYRGLTGVGYIAKSAVEKIPSFIMGVATMAAGLGSSYLARNTSFDPELLLTIGAIGAASGATGLVLSSENSRNQLMNRASLGAASVLQIQQNLAQRALGLLGAGVQQAGNFLSVGVNAVRNQAPNFGHQGLQFSLDTAQKIRNAAFITAPFVVNRVNDSVKIIREIGKTTVHLGSMAIRIMQHMSGLTPLVVNIIFYVSRLLARLSCATARRITDDAFHLGPEVSRALGNGRDFAVAQAPVAFDVAINLAEPPARMALHLSQELTEVAIDLAPVVSDLAVEEARATGRFIQHAAPLLASGTVAVVRPSARLSMNAARQTNRLLVNAAPIISRFILEQAQMVLQSASRARRLLMERCITWSHLTRDFISENAAYLQDEIRRVQRFTGPYIRSTIVQTIEFLKETGRLTKLMLGEIIEAYPASAGSLILAGTCYAVIQLAIENGSEEL